MIRLSPAKINLGLLIKRKREDGFHDLQSVVIPVPFCDLIEIVPSGASGQKVDFSQSGINPQIPSGENLCVKAFELFSKYYNAGSVKIHLHKQIPVGAGLGGGSSNAATILEMMNDLYGAPLSLETLAGLASELGSDCPLFLYHRPMLMEGRGEILSEIDLDMKGYYLLLLNPGLIISTAYAYRIVVPGDSGLNLPELILNRISSWKESIVNDFEAPLFSEFPVLQNLKNSLYEQGAVYAAMSGSGSSVYGIFERPPQLSPELKEKQIWMGELKPITQIQ